MGLQVRPLPETRMPDWVPVLGLLTNLPILLVAMFSPGMRKLCPVSCNQSVWASRSWNGDAHAAETMMGMCSQTSWHRALVLWA